MESLIQQADLMDKTAMDLYSFGRDCIDLETPIMLNAFAFKLKAKAQSIREDCDATMNKIIDYVESWDGIIGNDD